MLNLSIRCREGVSLTTRPSYRRWNSVQCPSYRRKGGPL